MQKYVQNAAMAARAIPDARRGPYGFIDG